jgi:hypothetical protein
MNAASWLTARDPTPMLKVLQSTQARRKARLFACACCARLGHLLPQESREGIETAARFADGLSSPAELDAAHAKANAAVMALPRPWSYDVVRLRYATSAAAECSSRQAATVPGAIAIASKAAHAVSLVGALDADEDDFTQTRDRARVAELAAQADLIREIFGSPFHPVAFLPDWCTDTAVLLARRMAEEREYSAMPILADALQDAGCDDPEILDHCRESGTHVSGCWVVDLVLGTARTQSAGDCPSPGLKEYS